MLDQYLEALALLIVTSRDMSSVFPHHNSSVLQVFKFEITSRISSHPQQMW